LLGFQPHEGVALHKVFNREVRLRREFIPKIARSANKQTAEEDEKRISRVKD
jgi:hypothetical protein